jgi:hypothetical protein
MKLFHKTFLNILENKDPLEKLEMQKISKDITKSEDIIHLAPSFIDGVKREQRLIKGSRDYYIARDLVTNTVYICFKHLLTIDIDDKNLDLHLIINHFQMIPETFRIYSSPRGYHIYCTSKEFDYRSEESVKLMFENFCDPYYCVYTYIRGYCTRLNNKFDNYGECVYKYVTKVGNIPENERLLKLVNKMESQSKRYKNDINLN